MLKQRSFAVLVMAIVLCVTFTAVSSEDLRVGQWSNKMARYTVRMVPIEKVEQQVENQIMGRRNRVVAPMWPGYSSYYRQAPYGY